MRWVLTACAAWSLMMNSCCFAYAQNITTMHVWLRAFIPKSVQSPSDYMKVTSNGTTAIEAPGINVAGYNIGPLSGTCFTTDNRGFDSRPEASSRVSIDFNLVFRGRREISVEKVSGRDIVNVGMTHNVDCVTGKDLKPPQQEDVSSVDIGTVRNNGFLRIFNIKAMSGNPFYRIGSIGVAPKIDLEVVFEYNPLTLTLDLHGVLGTFPSFEGYYSIANSSPKTIINLSPEPGSTALNLLDMGTGLNTRNFNTKIDLRPYLLQ